MTIDFPIVFDFDGTMIHSNELKEVTYFDVVGDVSAEQIISEIIEMGKVSYWDRYIILQKISATLNLNYKNLVQNYNKLLQSNLIKCEKRKGIDQFLLACTGLKVINSATPSAELKKSVKKIFSRQKFDLIVGDGAARKIKNLEFIIKKLSVAPDSIIVIGDGKDDYDSALHFDCMFFGISGGTLESSNLKLYDSYYDISRAFAAWSRGEIDEIP